MTTSDIQPTPTIASTPVSSASGFRNFALTPEILNRIQAMGLETPTPIQAMSLPLTLNGKDIIGIAQTGSGKTLAFLLPIYVHLLANRAGKALIMAPTRELAEQILQVSRKIQGTNPLFRESLLIGGTSMIPQIRGLQKGPRLIIATPGRLLDHMDRGSAHVDNVSMLVLDEADRMLDMGFAPQLERIRKAVPEKRQTMLFSATWPQEIRKLAATYLNDPKRIEIALEKHSRPKIDQKVIQTSDDEKLNVLVNELRKRPDGSVIIFMRTQLRTERMAKRLGHAGFMATMIHGGRSQVQRKQALEKFRKQDVKILIATDLAARGLDIDHVSCIMHFDLPQLAEDFVHRSGRTARAGRSGESVALLTQGDRVQWRQISKLFQT